MPYKDLEKKRAYEKRKRERRKDYNANYHQEWAKRNPEKCRNASRRWRENHHESVRAQNVKQQQRYHANPEPYITANALWYKQNVAWRKVKDRKVWLKKHYGITPETYDAMCKRQNNKCFICLSVGGTTASTKLGVDHCHKTKKVRALLCRKCNLIIGFANDSPQTLREAAVYLETHYAA